METFTCRASKESRVLEIKHEGGHSYLICEHCSAEHVFKRVSTMPGAPAEVRITGLRDTNDHRDGEPA